MPDHLRRRPQHGHIVIVDDNEEVRASLALMLRARGYKAETYASGRELLTRRPEESPTCFLIDYMMPNKNGIDLLQDMRDQGIDAPAFMITGYYSPGLARKAIDVGFGGVIEKPLPRDELMSKIESLPEARLSD